MLNVSIAAVLLFNYDMEIFLIEEGANFLKKSINFKIPINIYI